MLSDKLAPRGLAKTREQISRYAHQLVAEMVARGTFDGVVDVARVCPVNVVGDLVGLPMEGREKCSRYESVPLRVVPGQRASR